MNPLERLVVEPVVVPVDEGELDEDPPLLLPRLNPFCMLDVPEELEEEPVEAEEAEVEAYALAGLETVLVEPKDTLVNFEALKGVLAAAVPEAVVSVAAAAVWVPELSAEFCDVEVLLRKESIFRA